jgi:hypothetical protein
LRIDNAPPAPAQRAGGATRTDPRGCPNLGGLFSSTIAAFHEFFIEWKVLSMRFSHN